MSLRPENTAEAEVGPDTSETGMRTSSIDFGCPVPFTEIPRIIEEGLDFTRQLYASGNQKLLAHYEHARDCLEQALKDPLCDLLLMIVLTFTSSTHIPKLPQNKNNFEPGPEKNSQLLAVTLMTRMLWFLYPQCFPWDRDDGMILRIPEMMKRMEHRGISNRILCKLGWVVRNPTYKYRENPWNCELDLRPDKELLELRTKLLSLMNDPPAFISLVFNTQDDAWVERCLKIITTHTA
ncbi:hypothetical protein RAB80_016449 [Fusarium oxysporum f. sp. vasinfectum]|uniref:Uncharacterized protein n=1 Tax=Fusarium oxysporum f. sp. vasinfectum 25433 TaxID=1089449 RepID=X0M0Y5_FUSOX|nr:hypothetical protein FOTG_17260 [Fusarium oxysporum f. sp. vasinfectum 25433]KAK2667258.1 hypothetical protein RAB80_016449 [Fusarium oxysporum f. sp. vasinfectum]KAK2931876.1 hypothetical protein FoTM2_009394 [Fusarium oxysporum f. sp. vasinfectum]